MDTSKMTVAKLIEVLQKFDQGSPILFQDLNSTYVNMKFEQITEKHAIDGSTEIVIGVRA